MSKSDALMNGEVQELVYAWFRRLTDKVSLDEMLSMLSSDEFEMRFPDATIRSYADFKQWYEGVTNLFFDQVHDVKMLAVDLDGVQAGVTLVVNWQARTWKPPAPYSEWQGFNVHQTWTVKRDPGSGKPTITGYYVGEFDPMPGRPPHP
jgi:SnoaL-like domain